MYAVVKLDMSNLINHFKMPKTSFVIIGDAIVSKGYIDNGDVVWGSTIIVLIFVPNIIFMAWFVQGFNKKLCQKATWGKIVAVGSIQVITIIRYDI